MAERKRIGLIFIPDKGWMGGIYYILNLINALNSLDDEERPEITLLCRNEEDCNFAEKATHYPYLDFIPTFQYAAPVSRRVINKLSRILRGTNLVASYDVREDFDIIYPVISKFQIKSQSKLVYWIPDFQQLHLPQLFSEKDLKIRDRENRQIIDSGLPIVLSSEDALKDLNHFYPESKNRSTHVFHFATSIPSYDETLRDYILNKFGISGKFFFCANQVWQHKNHLTLLKAVNELKKSGKNIRVICSGNKSDYRNQEYTDTLFKYISDNNLNDNIKFLGLIERSELICLMKESIALVQPSLFEGWNTGIEEAKALNKFVIASDLLVHREQINKNVVFFNPHDPLDLAEKLWEEWSAPAQTEDMRYQAIIHQAGKEFMRIVEAVCKNN